MYGWKAKLAFMLPSSCLVFEQEFLQITQGISGVIGIPARLFITDCDISGLSKMNEQIDLAADQLETARPDLIAYMCTSGSFIEGTSGDEAIRRRIADRTGAPVISTSQTVAAALKAQGIKRPVMLTPYDRQVTAKEISWLASCGIEVVDFSYLNIPDNLERGALTPERVFDHARRLDWKRGDGIFLSCGNVRSLEIIAQLEEYTSRPVVSSAQATIWGMLHATRLQVETGDVGSLYLKPAPQSFCPTKSATLSEG